MTVRNRPQRTFIPATLLLPQFPLLPKRRRSPSWNHRLRRNDRPVLPDHHDDGIVAPQIPPAPDLPACGYLRRDNEGDGYHSHGWVFAPAWRFDEDKLFVLLSCATADRVKAVFRTDRGASAFNVADGTLKQSSLPEAPDSRVEILGTDPEAMAGFEAALMDCVVSRGE